jgi:hypothetical protein
VLSVRAVPGSGQTASSDLPVNKSQRVKKRRYERFFFTVGKKFTSKEKFTGKAASDRDAWCLTATRTG